jgi:hypothetical protein
MAPQPCNCAGKLRRPKAWLQGVVGASGWKSAAECVSGDSRTEMFEMPEKSRRRMAERTERPAVLLAVLLTACAAKIS